ncbi:MMPL family transporter [Halorussus salilacus]|uniref:efflux RND transporter permease subunit n=1 Tax=Halorussus salilacus TaxID=2953750 RepID=UPI00209C782C|nr:MMPL family transporter [Halorussus salilacus]USZ68398.1 MMPL family transporter [Halorussus salilacus]
MNRPGRVVAAFLLLTAVFAVGTGSVSTESGTEQFGEDVPEQTALDAVNREFDPAFAPGATSTQLIHTGENVVSKPALVRMLTLQHRLERRPGLRIVETTGPANVVATTLDPEATTAEEQLRAVERASPARIEAAVRTAASENPSFERLLSEDFNPRAASASASITVVEHAVPEFDAGEQTAGTDPLTAIQREMQSVAASVGGDVRVFGAGIIAAEFENVIGDTLLVVVPAAAVLIVAFLVVAYRDLADLLLGVVALVMAIIWTFGFMGFAGVAFNQILIAVPPLLLAVGIDFGIHAVNRYREDRRDLLGESADRGPAVFGGTDLPGAAMRRATDQLLVAFFIVTATSVIGFASNLTSQLIPIRDFGLVASVGIVFTALVFGVFLPAAKVLLDRARERYPIPTLSQSPLGSEGSSLAAALTVGVGISRRAPLVFLLMTALLTAGAAGYATGVDTSFSDEQFLPPEETPAYLDGLPEPFRPDEYTVTRDINFLEANFETSEDEQVVVYVEGPMGRDTALEALHRAGEDPPETFVRDGRHASEQSILTVVESLAATDPEFARLVARNDRDGNGIPDRDLDAVYDALLDSEYAPLASQYLTEDRRSARVVYSVRGDADQREVTADARTVADRFRYEATATGNIVVFQAISDLIFESAIVSLAVALVGTAAFLVAVYAALLGRPSLGVANFVPIVVTVAALAGTMRAVGISLNAFTATVLAITIGLGIDYSVHVVHRFVDEFEEREAQESRGDWASDREAQEPKGDWASDREAQEPRGDWASDGETSAPDGALVSNAGTGVPTTGRTPRTERPRREGARALAALDRTLVGTGGALTGSMLTTVFGIGVLVLAVFPAIGQFGLLTALSVVYAYLASILVLPSVLVTWVRLVGG